MVYILIFIAKLCEVALSTLRQVLTAKGSKYIPSALAGVEITIWIVVTSSVLSKINEDPLRAVALGLAFVAGVYLGILIENKLALGLSQIEIIAEFEVAKQITNGFREHGYGVTTYDCEGLDGKKLAVVLKVHRKDVSLSMSLLKDYKNLFVTVTDIRALSIGNIERRVLRHVKK